MDNEVLKCIRERRSIRRFKPDVVDDEALKAVLEAGTWAPTGKGTQDPWIVAVENKEQIATLSKINAEIMNNRLRPVLRCSGNSSCVRVKRQCQQLP